MFEKKDCMPFKTFFTLKMTSTYVCYHVHVCSIKCSISTYTMMAALAVQADEGDWNGKKHGTKNINGPNYVSKKNFVPEKILPIIIADIIDYHQHYQYIVYTNYSWI